MGAWAVAVEKEITSGMRNMSCNVAVLTWVRDGEISAIDVQHLTAIYLWDTLIYH